MDLKHLKENSERIIKEFEAERNPGDARHIRYEIGWLLAKAEENSWDTFEDAYNERISGKDYSETTKNNKRYYFRCIYRKLHPGAMPVPPVYCHHGDPADMLRLSKGYRLLNSGYQGLLDTYVCLAKEDGKKRDTIFTHCSLASGFLRHLQEKGISSLEKASDGAVLSFFYADRLYEQQIRSYSYREKLAVVFRTCMADPEYSAGCRCVLGMIPAFRYVRKNVEYLTAQEAEALRESIDSEKLSLRDKAIMLLLFYTGLRSCDVASIKHSDINWENETINIIQQKTSEPLETAMLPAVGNAVFEYIHSMGNAHPDGYLFQETQAPGTHISAVKVRNVARKVYRLAGIRQGKGEHKGTHLFRHRAATKMLENGVGRAVISRTLGHTSPDSLGPYLHADFQHLGEFALDISGYPVPEEVFDT